jgi:hypothetical protein
VRCACSRRVVELTGSARPARNADRARWTWISKAMSNASFRSGRCGRCVVIFAAEGVLTFGAQPAVP